MEKGKALDSGTPVRVPNCGSSGGGGTSLDFQPTLYCQQQQQQQHYYHQWNAWQSQQHLAREYYQVQLHMQQNQVYWNGFAWVYPDGRLYEHFSQAPTPCRAWSTGPPEVLFSRKNEKNTGNNHGQGSHLKGPKRFPRKNNLEISQTLALVESMMRAKDAWLCSIDVECVATGVLNHERAVAQVVLVDSSETVVFNELVKPDVEIKSYMTPLTGIIPGSLDNADSLKQVRERLLNALPKEAVIVGQAIHKDMEWLGLEKGTHYRDQFDIGKLFQIHFRNGHSRFFSMRHQVLHLSGFKGAGSDMQSGAHDPILDAIFSLRLFAKFSKGSSKELLLAQQSLSRAPETQPFWKTTPLLDGCQTGPPHIYR